MRVTLGVQCLESHGEVPESGGFFVLTWQGRDYDHEGGFA